MAYIAKVSAGGNADMLVGSTLYGNCTTGASTVAKAVAISGFDTLLNGVTVHVRFANSNTAASPTLNVSSTGAKPIYKYGTTVPGTVASTSWQAGSVISFTYSTDAVSTGAWVMNDHLDDTDTAQNQNAFSNVKVGSTTIAADTTTDTIEIAAGSNITLTPDATNDKVTIAATDTTYSDFTGATASAAGTHGLVPAPASGSTQKLLQSDGSWVSPMSVVSNIYENATGFIYGEDGAISIIDTVPVSSGGTGVSTLDAGVVYHSASGTGALSIATAANLVSAIGTNAVARATADASGNTISSTYQAKLVSGTSIKTINNESLLGSGNITISGGSADVGNAKVFYGTSATGAGTQAKAVVCDEFSASDIVAGAVIFVKFTNGQTYNGTPTLNINSTGAHGVRRYGTTNAPRYWWIAGEVVGFIYDGSYWLTLRGGLATTTYWGLTKLENSVTSTSTSYAATSNSVKLAYDHADDVIAPEAGVVTLVYTGGGGQLETGTGVWRSGNVVTVHLQYSSTTAMQWGDETMASIPTGFAPSSAMRFPVFGTNGWATPYIIGYAVVGTDGNINVWMQQTSVVFGTFTYVVAAS